MKNHLQHKRHPSRGGFSLVEVTLAMLVVAVGILSVMSLFPTGLDQNARSIADTRMAFFAEDVFSGLHAWAQDDWEDLADAMIPVAAEDVWYIDADNLYYTQANWPDFYTNKYFITNAITPGQLPPFEKYALRFSLGIQNNAYNTIKSATLWVWAGEFGTTNNPTIFYTEFFNYTP